MLPKRILIDSDAKNEIDDQYAIVRALIAPELHVEAITAAGFHDRENGARLSYEEEVRILELMGLKGRIPVAMGSPVPMIDKHTPRPTEAAELIVKHAMATASEPLYVLALGQFTNLASALLMEPRIKERAVFACIDGDYKHGETPAWGPGCYNWKNDVPAVQAIFESNIPYIHIPAPSVSNKMRIARHIVVEKLSEIAPIYDFLISLWPEDQESWILWDIALVHMMIEPNHGMRVNVPAPNVNDNGTTKDTPENPRRITVYADIEPETIYQSYWDAVRAFGACNS